MAKYADFQDALQHAKAVVAEQSAKPTAQVNEMAARIVEKFEQAVPKHAGLIPKNAIDLFVFFAYLSLVSYILLEALHWGLWLTLKVFCFFCCCGFCRMCRKQSKGGPVKSKSAKKKEKEMAATKAPVHSPDAKVEPK